MLTACLAVMLFIQPTAWAHEKPSAQQARPVVDVAILLDTSNSMDGLIDQAKSQLWTIVNEFAAAKKHGLTPRLRVALFEYGNTNLPASEGYIRQVVPLTHDLDTLSEALFALTTSGGDEYCGQVIDEAVKRLDWSGEQGAYKAIFIAGNEPFTQGSVDYKQACAYAIQSGVIVNTIHCGDYDQGIAGMWSHGATLAEGNYLNINQDKAVIHIDAPQDSELIKLNIQLNSTYLWYGEQGQLAKSRQAVQDENAAGYGLSSLATRVASKATGVYTNDGADLVDAVEAKSVELSTIKKEDLPATMREMEADERVVYVEEQAGKRADLQARIQVLTAERDAYVAQERRAKAEAAGEGTLGDAVVTSIREQLDEAGFEIKGAEGLAE